MSSYHTRYLCLSLFKSNDVLSEGMQIAILKFETDIDQEVLLLPAISLAHEKFDVSIKLGLNVLGSI